MTETPKTAQEAAPAFFILSFDNRSDGGPRTVGPFNSREAAFDYAHSLAHQGWSASYEAIPVSPVAVEGGTP